jgi:hypothetical protein
MRWVSRLDLAASSPFLAFAQGRHLCLDKRAAFLIISSCIESINPESRLPFAGLHETPEAVLASWRSA